MTLENLKKDVECIGDTFGLWYETCVHKRKTKEDDIEFEVREIQIKFTNPLTTPHKSFSYYIESFMWKNFQTDENMYKAFIRLLKDKVEFYLCNI